MEKKCHEEKSETKKDISKEEVEEAIKNLKVSKGGKRKEKDGYTLSVEKRDTKRLGK